MESAVHASVPLRVGKKMRKRRELDALVGGGGSRSGRLLSASSDEGEPWGRRAVKRRRPRPFVRLIAALALVVCVVCAATVLWLFVDVRRQIVSLRVEMDKVSITRNSVDDALQDCHTAVKELRNNASDLSRRLDKLELDHAELTKTVELIQKAQKEAPLAAAPSLAKTQRRLDDLQILVADLGSQINGFDGTINTARKQAVAAASGVEDVKTLFHQLEARSNETIANVTANAKRDEEIRSQVTALNTTLAARVDELQHRIEDMSKPTSTVAPTTSTTQSTSSSTSTTSTTTEVPEPPTKPSVLASV